jgi:alkylhydroperoxidase/carboxymuconolactone decarboxylase family protein YurZ
MTVLSERKARGVNDNMGAAASPIVADGDKYARGKKILESLTGSSDPGKTTGFGAFSPEIETFLKEHLFADIFERDVLNYTDRELVTIAALISQGGVEPMLQSHMRMGMNVGISEAQLQQVLVLLDTPGIGAQEVRRGREVLRRVLGH